MPDDTSTQGRRTFTAPRPIPITAAHVGAIAAAHGLPNGPLEPIASTGIINSLYVLGHRFVLRVPRDHPGHVAQAHREAAAIPAAVHAGVTTPGLVLFDQSLEILPVPFLIVDRVDGTDAESLGAHPPEPREAWRLLGADLARLHGTQTQPPPGEPWPDEHRDPRHLAELRAEEGWLSPLEVRRLHTWFDRLAPLVAAPKAVFLHGDLQMSNVLLDHASGAYRALIDWGGARRGNPADDFSVVPLAAVGPMLEGYREVRAADPGVTEAGIVWRRMQLVLSLLPRGAAPAWAWGERPVARLTDMLLTLNELQDPVWRELAPRHPIGG